MLAMVGYFLINLFCFNDNDEYPTLVVYFQVVLITCRYGKSDKSIDYPFVLSEWNLSPDMSMSKNKKLKFSITRPN